MILMLTAGALLLGVATAWLALFPEGRALGRRARLVLGGVNAVGGGVSQRLGRRLSSSVGVTRHAVSGMRRHWREDRSAFLAAATMVLAPPLLMLVLDRATPASDAGDPPRARDAHIARLLHGERLSPPPPLPPEAFTTREVERVRPQLRGADREWIRLDPDFQSRLLRVFEAMRALHGYELVLLEGYRSPERQQQLAALGPHVTNAGMYQSYHQFGLAADVAFLREGRVVISERDPWAMRGYELYGELAEAHGLTWGGRWRMRDYGHVELRRPGARQAAAGGNL